MVRDYFQYPDESRKAFKYWLKKRHPSMGYSNGTILFWAIFALLTLVLLMQCIGSQTWWLMYFPLGLWVVKEMWSNISIFWGMFHSPAKKFRAYQRPKRESNLIQSVLMLVLLLLVRWFPKLAESQIEVSIAEDLIDEMVSPVVEIEPFVEVTTQHVSLVALIERNKSLRVTSTPEVQIEQAAMISTVAPARPQRKKAKKSRRKPRKGLLLGMMDWLLTPSDFEARLNDQLKRVVSVRFVKKVGVSGWFIGLLLRALLK
jgi:signal transduction histidine kinase